MSGPSLGEAEALAAKAARGAGLPWGLAEEAGFAARWLCARGVDGLSALARHLTWLDGRWRDAAPRSALLRGVALSDAGLSAPATLPRLRDPILTMPFLGDVARAAGRPVALRADGLAVVTDGRSLAGEVGRLLDTREAAAAIAFADAMPPGRHPPDPPTDKDANRILDALAHRTLVPASDASRAGAGEAAPGQD